ncbi:MAG: hypothetical protein BZ138_00890 [Methanosphaera sp. rholeuAM270]|nr:MAG: hypothetical protein BZ138_00890 [Methanosphaera sp. rholeuAM270]
MTKSPDEVLQEVLDTINPLRGVQSVGVLNDEVRKHIIEIEMEKSGELIPVINYGVHECLSREYTVAIIKTATFRPPPTPTVQLVDNRGNILGEEIVNNEQKKKHEANENATFVTPDFVLTQDPKELEKDLKSEVLEKQGAKQAFVLPPVPFVEVEELEDTCDVVSSSPDPLADLYIKEYFNFEDDAKLASILVGFNVKKD